MLQATVILALGMDGDVDLFKWSSDNGLLDLGVDVGYDHCAFDTRVSSFSLLVNEIYNITASGTVHNDLTPPGEEQVGFELSMSSQANGKVKYSLTRNIVQVAKPDNLAAADDIIMDDEEGLNQDSGAVDNLIAQLNGGEDDSGEASITAAVTGVTLTNAQISGTIQALVDANTYNVSARDINGIRQEMGRVDPENGELLWAGIVGLQTVSLQIEWQVSSNAENQPVGGEAVDGLTPYIRFTHQAPPDMPPPS